MSVAGAKTRRAYEAIDICTYLYQMPLQISIDSNGGENAMQQYSILCWGKSEALGRSVASVASTDSLNLTETLTLTKWTDVRAASENTPFFGHVTWTAVKTPPVEST